VETSQEDNTSDVEGTGLSAPQEAPKEAPKEAPQEAPKDTPEELIIPKIAEGSVDGQVSCVEGPMINATVSIGMITTLSDAKGNFLLEHVPPGIAKVRVKSPTTRFYDSSVDVLVETDKRKNMFIFLKEVTGTVEGNITDESGKFLAGAEVYSLFRLGKDAITAKTDEKGHYIFTDIPRGNYFVRAKAKGYMTEGISVNVTGGSTALTNFTLKPASLSITGRVVNKAGAPVDCEIYLLRKGIVVTKVKTASTGDGTFEIADLVPDTYEMTTSAAGLMPKAWFGKLEKSEVINFELDEMPPPQDQTRNGN
jgi:hypothetical protein